MEKVSKPTLEESFELPELFWVTQKTSCYVRLNISWMHDFLLVVCTYECSNVKTINH